MGKLWRGGRAKLAQLCCPRRLVAAKSDTAVAPEQHIAACSLGVPGSAVKSWLTLPECWSLMG